ncbi:MAG TPA: NAD(P)-dependent alcohol dehydrogenase [bacterium]|nr:NAD(P)-dependent alcohol dehydrogenase [bacterium]
MPSAKAYAAHKAKEPLKPFDLQRREPGPRDVLIDILFCGVCHSDLHQVRGEWGFDNAYPMVPGHEIVGKVEAVGGKVSKFKTGDTVGVGVFVDSCRDCESCKEGLEQYCENAPLWTYGGVEKETGKPTYGGYSTKIVADENYVLKVSPKLKLHEAAPLLCAGITTYSPLRHWGAGPGKKVGILGLGGLGHMGVKLAAAMGAEVTVLSSSPKKVEDAKRLGAKRFADTTSPKTFGEYANYFHLIIDAVSADHDFTKYMDLLKRDGTLALVGLPPKAPAIVPFALTSKRRAVAGSQVGSIKETQEMLDFCAQHGLGADVEVIPMQKINEAFERMSRNDVRYRFVIDMASLKG